MKTLAFIAHPYHRLTGSTQIFDFLSEYFVVKKFYDNRWGTGTVDVDEIKTFDINFYFQTTPIFPHKNLVWTPMVDDNIFTDIPNVKYLCLCKWLYESLKDVQKMYAQYWKKPEDFNSSNSKVIMFWNRKPDIAWDNVKKFFLTEKIDKVYFKNSPDPSFDKVVVSQEDIERFNVQMVEFEEEKIYNERMKEVTILICPRSVEGVGLFMLDGFSRGCLVFGYDNPTMNEYIVNLENGILFNSWCYNPLNLWNFQQIREKSYSSCVNGYNDWIKSIPEILSFIES